MNDTLPFFRCFQVVDAGRKHRTSAARRIAALSSEVKPANIDEEMAKSSAYPAGFEMRSATFAAFVKK